MDRYKLVVFGDHWDVCQFAHRDWIENPLVRYIPTYRPVGLLGQIQRIHVNPRLNSIVPMPFKPCWNSYYLRGLEAGYLCFLVTEHWLRMESAIRLLPYLRHHYSHSRIICFTQDMVDTIRDHYTRRPIDLEHMRRYADLLISYDPVDAQQHDMLYHPTVYSPINIATKNMQSLFDLYFLGRDKGRLRHLINICHEAQRRGLRCHFLMLEVPKENQMPCDGVTYLDAQLSYADNLRLCAQSRCIVEMLQQDACSPTFRTWEAIVLNRRLITNNVAFAQSPFYDDRYACVFHDETDFDWEFVMSDNVFPDNMNSYREAIRPESLVNFIEDKLHIEIDR